MPGVSDLALSAASAGAFAGAWAAIKDANSNQHRSLAKALEPLHEHLFTLRHYTGLQKLAAVKTMVQQAHQVFSRASRSSSV